MSTDIIARLQLRAEQFSSETGARFSELKTRARSAAQDVRSEFTSAFADVQKVAQTALQLPRTSTGSLDLSTEIRQLNASASAADQRSAALRELSIAQTAAANAANVNRQAMLLEADAAAVASLAEEQHAQELREKIVALEAVQRELNQTASATRALTNEEEQAARRTGGNFNMLGQQLIDFTVQVNSGQSMVTAFVQQLPQATYALSTMGGAAGRVGSILVGPFGTALTIATIAAAPFVAKLWEGEQAAKAVELATSSLGEAENDLAAIFGKTSSKIAEQNELLLINARIKAASLRIEAAEDRKKALQTFGRAGQSMYGVPGAEGLMALGIGRGNSDVRDLAARATRAANAQRLTGESDAQFAAFQGKLFDQIIKDSEKADFKGAGYSKNDFLESISKLAGANANEKIASLIDESLNSGKIVSGLQKPERTKKTPKGRDLGGMTNSAEEEIARINAEWDAQPKLIDKAFLQTQKLDNLIGDLSKKKPPNWEILVRQAEAAKQTIQRGLITAIGKAFEEPETVTQRGLVAIGELDRIVANLSERKPPDWAQLVEQAERTKDVIRDGMNRPLTEFVRQQRESLAVGQLVLAGRDAEADALRDTLRVQEQLGRTLKDDELATVLELAEQHDRITRSLEAQRRLVGIYTGAVDDLQRSFDQFLQDLTERPADALTNAAGNFVGSLQRMQRDLLSNAVFGGVDKQVEDYVRRMTGQKTPAEILADQAKDAGKELRTRVTDSGDALADFAAMVRATTAQLGGYGVGGSVSGPVGDGKAIGDAIAKSIVTDAFDTVAANIANDNGTDVVGNEEIVVTAQIDKIDQSAGNLVRASDVLGITVDGIAANLKANLGIEVPREVISALKKGLPTVLEGVTLGQVGGSVFSSITGGKDDKLASSLGGVVGGVAGKALSGTITKVIGGTLGKTLGGAAGPIGSVVGGILGNVIGGLFNKPQFGTAILTSASGPVSANGRGSSSIAAASGIAGSVQEGLTRLADQLGATLGNFDTVVGMFDGKYRVRTTAAGWDGKGALDFKGNSKNNLYDFGSDQQAAIAFAIADAVRDGAIQGLSAASSAILRKSTDLEKAVQKVVLIESIPKNLKAMLDPVGSAIDELNRKWKRTKDALDEGGASAEQYAQAQRLYDLELAQVKNSTASASQSLKDFVKSLQIGSSSPLSLRDQEAAAMAQLRPFLEQINGGQSVDQEKYREAAQSYLDIERRLYGSTQGFFDAFEAIQAATNKAIAAIDKVAPVSPAVESPFAKSTAESVKTLTEQTDSTNALLARIAQRLENMNVGGGDSGFIGNGRGFNSAANY